LIRQRIKSLVILCLIVTQIESLSGIDIFPSLGYQRAGTSALTFLKIGIGSRGAAMGGAFVSIANDASCLYWNPAGLAQMTSSEFYTSRIEWPADIQYDYLGLAYKFSPNVAFGLSGGCLHTGAMDVTTEYMPHGTGEKFYYSDYFIGLSAAQRVTEHFSWGLTLKYVEENIAEVSSHTPMIDIGSYYWTGFKSLRFAVSLTNFGPEVAFKGQYDKPVIEGGTVKANYEEFPLPTIFRLGAAMEVINSEKNKLTVAAQLNHPVDNIETFSVGFEDSFSKYLFIRGGKILNNAEEVFNTGLGLQLPLGKKMFILDYSFTKMVYLTDIQRYTIRLAL
jgi:hypothetical protein